MGFFFADTGPVKGSGRTVTIDPLHRLECKACPLDRADVLSPKMEPSGSKKPFAYMLGEAPGEVAEGLIFLSHLGNLLGY